MIQRTYSRKPVTIAELRRSAPEWTWRAERDGYGIGWRYHGECGDRKATVQAYSALCGFADDESYLVWQVQEADRHEPLWFWLMSVK